MKFALAILFTLALALGVQSSIVPWGAWSHALHGDDGQWRGDWHGDDGQWHGDLPGHDGQWHGDWHSAGAWGAGAWGAGPHAAVVVSSGHHAAHGPALVVNGVHAHAPIVAVAHPHHEGHYVAKTRGAVHSAPLAGHAASAASINLQPAPGTI